MSRTILKTPSSQNRGKAFSSSWFDTFTKFSTDLYIVKYSVLIVFQITVNKSERRNAESISMLFCLKKFMRKRIKCFKQVC